MRTLLTLGSALIALTLVGLCMHQLLVEPRGKAFDFFTVWFGIRRIWRGQDPYGAEATKAIQRHIFSNTLPPSSNQQGFVYPLYIAWVLGPVAALPFPLAVTVWLTLQFCSLTALPLLIARAFRWGMSRGDLIVFSLAALMVFRYPTVALVLGQTTIPVMLGAVLSLYWLGRGNDLLAGVAVALTLVKPNLSGMIVIAVLGWSLLHGRLKVLAGISGALTLLLGISFAWQPAWITGFVKGARAYVSYANVVWPFRQFNQTHIAGTALLTVAGLTTYSGVKAARSRRQMDFLLAFCFTVILSLAALPQTGLYDLTMLLIPAVGFVALAPQDRWVRAGVLGSLVSPWLYWWLRMRWGTEIEQIALPLQFATIGARVLAVRRTGTSPGGVRQCDSTSRSGWRETG